MVMKFLLAFSFLIYSYSIFSQNTVRAAFLGNSYTFYNALPVLIDSLANADGNDLIHQQNTPGGYTLEGHTTNVMSLSLLTADNWDFVVMQEQSQRPSFPHSQVVSDVYPYAKILSDSIRAANACAIPVFFNTWGRLNGDQQWDSINTFEKMNNRLYAAYNYMAYVNSGILSPVGLAFKAIYDDTNAVVSHSSLYDPDGSHPSIFGSYLAACIFYNTLFSADATGNSYLPSGISQAEASYLQDIAFNVMYMATSPIFDFSYPQASFSYAVSNGTVMFTNTSVHAFTYTWSFGDNTFSTDENPSHTYTESDTYVVLLTASYCDRSATFQQTIEISGLGIDDNKTQVKIAPNPFKEVINLQLNAVVNGCSIIAIDGKTVLTNSHKQSQYAIDLSGYPAGIYFISIQTDDQQIVRKVVKQ